MQVSEKHTNYRCMLRGVAHTAGQELGRAREIDSDITISERDVANLSPTYKQLMDDFDLIDLFRVQVDCDARFGWHGRVRQAAGAAAGRLHPLPSAAALDEYPPLGFLHQPAAGTERLRDASQTARQTECKQR